MKFLGSVFLFAAAYFLAGKLGLSLATLNSSVSPVWPATGLAISLLFLKGIRYWPAVAIGAFFVNLLTAAPLLAILSITVGNTLEAFLGFILLNLFLKNQEKFSPHAKTIAIVSASLISALISATIGSLSLTLFEVSSWDNFSSIWFTWWTGDVLGGIFFIPLCLAFFKNGFGPSVSQKAKTTNVVLVFLSGILLCYFIFFRPSGAPFLFLIFPLLLWSVHALGEKGVSVMTAMISFIGIISVELGFGVFMHGSDNANLINLQLFLASVGISSLVISDIKRISSLKQPAIVFLFSWLLAGICLYGFFNKTLNDSEEHFTVMVDGIEPLLDARIKLYFSGLQSGKALFAASEKVTKNEWKSFLQNGQINQGLPGIQGMGVIFRVPKDKLGAYVQRIKKDEIQDFNYHVLPGGEAYARIFSEAYVVTYIEPRFGNEKKIGLDLASEPIRKSAADMARDLGEPSLTSSIQLIDDVAQKPSFLAFYPFYKDGQTPKTVFERRLLHLGWIYAPIYIKDFFASVFSLSNFQEISYAVYQKVNDQPELISSSADYFKLPSSGEQIREIKLGNRLLLFLFKRSASFYAHQEDFAAWSGAISSMISLLLGTFIISIQRVKRRALELVNKKTRDLKDSEELWKYALQGAGDGVWDLYIPQKIIKFTKNFKESLGYTEDELSDSLHDWDKMVHPDDLPNLRRMFKKHLLDRGFYNVEYRLHCKSGDYKWFLARGSVVSWSEEGRALRMVGTITDITSRKNAEHELESQKEKLHSIFEGSSDAIMLFDVDKGFFDCNSQTLKLFGLKNKSELLALNPSQLSPKFQSDGVESKKKSEQQIEKAFKEGSNHFEWLHRKANGETFPAEVMLTAFTYEGKEVVQACVRDLTERKLTESALSAHREKLIASAKMSSLGEMAGGIAHEINNPLAIILGKTTQIKRRLKEDSNIEQFTEGLLTIEATAKRISAIIKGLSAFSRNAENDSMEKVLVPVLIQDTLELSKERFRFHSINLKYDLRAAEKTYVNGRAAQLLQVLVNLLNNSYDAIENLPEKWVEIDTEVTDSICRISITDSGPGISLDLVGKIMSPFFSTKSVSKGTGLGLSISKGIIEDHKGRLFYDENCDHTRFVIELPVA